MLTLEMQNQAMANRFENFKRELDSFAKKCEAIKKVEAAGFDLVKNQWYICCSHEIPKERLGELRKIVGRVQVESKCPAGDFETTNELLIYIRPMSEEFKCMQFTYRTKFRGGGKCRVVTHASTYQTLVCEK